MKLLASDFDGTIFFPMEEPQVRLTTQKAIKDFQSDGNLFGLSTGRPMYSALEATKGLIDYDFFICDSGSYIQDKNGNILLDKPLPTEIVRELINNNTQYKKFIHIDQHFFYWLEGSEPWATEDMICKSIEGIENHKVHNITYICENMEEAGEVAKMIREKYDGLLTAYNNGHLVDIVCAECSKGNGVKIVEEYYKPTKTAGIGDGHNDLPLLAAVNTAFTFDYAPSDVQAKADHVVSKIDEALKIFEQD